MPKSQKCVLLTGASRGLGAAIAEHLAARGYLVYAGVRQMPATSSHANICYVTLDVCHQASIDTVLQTIVSHGHGVDVLINNAGLSHAAPLEELDLLAARQLFDTNVWGAVSLCQAVLPIMRSQGHGLIINITSIAAEISLPFRALYSASKSALSAFTQALRLEVKNQGVVVCELQPGDFKTDIFSEADKLAKPSVHEYAADYIASISKAEQHMQNAPQPLIVAETVASIITENGRRPIYKCGSALQRLAPYLKRLLPSLVFEKILQHSLNN